MKDSIKSIQFTKDCLIKYLSGSLKATECQKMFFIADCLGETSLTIASAFNSPVPKAYKQTKEQIKTNVSKFYLK